MAKETLNKIEFVFKNCNNITIIMNEENNKENNRSITFNSSGSTIIDRSYIGSTIITSESKVQEPVPSEADAQLPYRHAIGEATEVPAPNSTTPNIPNQTYYQMQGGLPPTA